MHARAMSVLLLCTSGCAASHAPEPEPTYEPGRVLVQIDRPESGEETFVQFYDAELDWPCELGRAEDGRLRCLPWALGSFSGDYGDARCEDAVVTEGSGCQYRYAWEYLPDPACDPDNHRPIRVFELGPLEDVATRVFRRTDTGCSAFTVARVRRATPIAPSRFVPGEVAVEPAPPGRLAAHTVRWATGAEGPAGFVDTRRGRECTISERFGVDTAPCLPNLRLRPRLGGPSCADLWAYDQPRGCPTPDLAWGNVGGGTSFCGEDQILASVGPLVPDGRSIAGSGCTIPNPGDVYRLDPSPDDAVPWLTLGRTGTGRLQRRVWMDEDGREWPFVGARYWDTELGIPCHSSAQSGGLCLPAWARTLSADQRRFEDPTCTRPAVWMTAVECSRSWVWHVSCALGGAPPEVYRVGEAIEGPPFWIDDSGACVVDTRTEGGRLFRLEPMPLDQFARVERTMR